jgi:alanyl-tRNA synthetase
VHVNFVDPSLKAKGLDARAWASNVTAIIGGKVRLFHHYNFMPSPDMELSIMFCQAGGKDDGAQGAGTDISKVDEAVAAAKAFVAGIVSNA